MTERGLAYIISSMLDSKIVGIEIASRKDFRRESVALLPFIYFSMDGFPNASIEADLDSFLRKWNLSGDLYFLISKLETFIRESKIKSVELKLSLMVG